MRTIKETTMNDTANVTLRPVESARGRVTAEVISCPGLLSDDAYSALQINIDGFESPYVLRLLCGRSATEHSASKVTPSRYARQSRRR